MNDPSARGSGLAGLLRHLPSVRWRRRAFWGYVLLLFTGTHWPRLELPPTFIERPDIIVHIGAFGLWTLLLIGSEYLGPLPARRAIVLCGLISLANSALDEGLQAIPFVHRTCAWDDWAADAAGVTLATMVALLMRTRVGKRPNSAA